MYNPINSVNYNQPNPGYNTMNYPMAGMPVPYANMYGYSSMQQEQAKKPDIFKNCSLETKKVIDGIIFECSRYDAYKRTLQDNNDVKNLEKRPEYKETMKRCVHIIYKDGSYTAPLVKKPDGKCVCTVCNQEISTGYTAAEVNQILDIIPIINQMVLMGLDHGIPAAHMKLLCDLKVNLVSAADIKTQLNMYFVKDSAQSSNNSLESSYLGGASKSITGYSSF